MKRDKQFLIVIIILMELSYYLFKAKISADDNTKIYQDSIRDYYRPYKLGYTRANTALKYTDSLFESGFIINLSDCSENEIKRRMNLILK